MKPLFVYDDELLKYRFSDTHPFNQMRLKLTKDLLMDANFLKENDLVKPRTATLEELELVHSHDYISAVQKAGHGELSHEDEIKYGLNTDDTPNFQDMHEKCSLIVGASLTAVDLVMSGATKQAVSLAGGLHHGFQGKASGFCIYNDAAIACEYITQKYGKKVLYVDTDAHHGDGVQWSFYARNDIVTYSIHETGRYLFPGTGSATERGTEEGFGYTVNIPIDAFTEDDSFIDVFTESLEKAIQKFQPDVILSQNGVDAHYRDPMTHLSLTSKSYEKIPRFVKKMADKYTDGKWIALGGGGYNIWQVVPRMWSQIWLAMKDIDAPRGYLPEQFISNYKNQCQVLFPNKWEDDLDDYMTIPRKIEITEKNRSTLDRILMYFDQ
jgi:acetoin utilization protein AcuC